MEGLDTLNVVIKVRILNRQPNFCLRDFIVMDNGVFKLAALPHYVEVVEAVDTWVLKTHEASLVPVRIWSSTPI